MMTDETIVAVYESAVLADAAVKDLEAASIPPSAISRTSSAATSGLTTSDQPVRQQGFWSNLFGGQPDHDTALYDRSLERGSHVVTVKVSEASVASVASILERHDPIDIDEPASDYRLSLAGTDDPVETIHGLPVPRVNPAMNPAVPLAPTPGSTATAAGGTSRSATVGGEETIALSEEQLNVGKRVVNRGTTRVRRFVVETPVEENVTLHSERVSVERRPVSGDVPVTDADFTDRTIEMTESYEEAVVAKTARVKEEVVVRKDVTDRVETIHDTVRHEDVEITKDDNHETLVQRGTDTVVPSGPIPTEASLRSGESAHQNKG